MSQPENEKYAELALPSAAVIGQLDASEWLAAIIGRGKQRMAQAAVIGVIDLAARQGYVMEERAARSLEDAIICRFESGATNSAEEYELVPYLVWSLGAIATKAQLERVASIIAKSFESPQWLEDAAAVTAGRLLFKRFPFKAQKALGEALGGRDSPAYMKFELAILPPTELNYGANGFAQAGVGNDSAG
jgi:hypothetical protein